MHYIIIVGLANRWICVETYRTIIRSDTRGFNIHSVISSAIGLNDVVYKISQRRAVR